jgi:hypothetical protein
MWNEEIIRSRNLPHWDVRTAAYCVTVCLEGSIPARGPLEQPNPKKKSTVCPLCDRVSDVSAVRYCDWGTIPWQADQDNHQFDGKPITSWEGHNMTPDMFWYVIVPLCDSLVAVAAGALAGWLAVRVRPGLPRWSVAVLGTTVLGVAISLAFGAWFGMTFLPESNIVPVPLVFPFFLLLAGPVVGLLVGLVCQGWRKKGSAIDPADKR